MFFDDHEVIELIAFPPIVLLLAFLLVVLAAPPSATAVPVPSAPAPASTGRPQVVLALHVGGRR